MKATLIYCKNYNDIERAKQLSINVPLPQYEEKDIYFQPDAVDAMYLDDDGYIILQISNYLYRIKWDEMLYKKLKDIMSEYE